MAGRADLSSPGFTVATIVGAREVRIPGQIDPSTLGQRLGESEDIGARVLQFEYDDAERTQDLLKLRVDNSDLRFWDNPAWLKGNVVRFSFGYPGKLFGPRYAVVDSVRGFRTLEIQASAIESLANDAKTRLWRAQTRVQIVTALVNERAFGRTVTDLAVDASTIAAEQSDDYQQSRQTDWQFVQRLAEPVGYEVYVQDTVLHFHPRRIGEAPCRKYEYFYGEGDLLDFQVDDFKTNDRVATVEVSGWDPVARAPIRATGSDSTTKRDVTGKESTAGIQSTVKTIAPGEKGALIAGTKQVPTPKTDPATVKAIADAHFRFGEQNEVRATAKIVGDPLLAAKSLVEIVGISKTLSGLYYVERVTHRIAPGSPGVYVSTLKLFKNAMGVLPTSDPPLVDPTKARENTQDVPQGSGRRIVEGQGGALVTIPPPGSSRP